MLLFKSPEREWRGGESSEDQVKYYLPPGFIFSAPAPPHLLYNNTCEYGCLYEIPARHYVSLLQGQTADSTAFWQDSYFLSMLYV